MGCPPFSYGGGMDEAHKWTDGQIADIAKRLRKVYATAAASVEKQLKDELREYERERKKRSDALAREMQGLPWAERRRLMDEFIEWRSQALAAATQRNALLDKINYELLDADRIAREMVAGRMGEAFSANADWATFELEKGLGKTCAAWTMYDQDTLARLVTETPDLYPTPDLDVQKAWKWNASHLDSVIAQAVVSGASVERIAKDMRGVFAMNLNDSMRVTRTAMTAAENAGRVQGYKRAKAMGIEVRQTWLATLDERTRASHRQLDGQSVEVGGVFENGCRYPGDPHGAPAEVMNCRCTLVSEVYGEGTVTEFDGRWKRLPEDMTYDEWREMKKHGQGD